MNRNGTSSKPSLEEQKKDIGLVTAPVISLPKGGGAIHGIGEKFAANPVTGTGAISVPIATSPGRSGFSPQLSISYDSGTGNGPFGLGWHLSLPSITRKTDKGLPRYFEAQNSDVFILSGAEDLVPALVKNGLGEWIEEQVPNGHTGADEFHIRRYRPRIEGLFARIERWTNTGDATDVRWRSISKDNITTWYGCDSGSRIADPTDLSHVFSWLISRTHDDKGNVMVYDYALENDHNIDPSHSLAHERNRLASSRIANRYPRSVRYGNRTPYFPSYVSGNVTALPSDGDWMFSVVFDYGEGNYQSHSEPTDVPQIVNVAFDLSTALTAWPVRQDPFSSCRAGFEVRTYRLCRRVLMFHHFASELNTAACLVRSTEFNYTEEPLTSFVTSVVQSGYLRQEEGVYRRRSLPSLEFEYTRAEISAEVRDVDPTSLENLPAGLDGSNYQWIDLDGEGLSGILAEKNGAWYYKRNLSALPQPDGAGGMETRANFAPVECVTRVPVSALAPGRRHQFLDLAGDGELDVVEFGGTSPGFYERTANGDWKPHQAFRSLPNLEWDDPNLRFLDLTGDGFADILLTEHNVFSYHPSLAEDGFGPAERVDQSFDENMGPTLIQADATAGIFTADMSGDGLADLVRIRNGEVCFWPNLGYGRFGAKVTLDNSPWFDAADQFDPKRLRLADIDGSGTTDLIYLGRRRIGIYRNFSGNSFGDAEAGIIFPAVDDVDAVQACDLLGNGTACLVWSSPHQADAGRQMRYIDLMGGQKPHLLVKTINNLGAETHVQYAPSTKFYLADKLAGRPWITRLPFPVHVVEKVDVYDYVSRNRFVTSYAYHHGYFDGVEREFRGFAMIEQKDTEQLAAMVGSSIFPSGDNIDAASHVPPVLTKTWFHTGAFFDRRHISDYFAAAQGGYFREPGLTDTDARAMLLPDTVLPPDLTSDEEFEACRSLKGAMLRQEVYALDGSATESFPYTVTEQNFDLRVTQPKENNLHGVFFAHAKETISYHYERIPADPRIQHTIALEVDGFGSVLKSAAIGYPRRKNIRSPDAAGNWSLIPNPGLEELPTDADRQKQTDLLLVTYTENLVTNPIDDTLKKSDGTVNYPDAYRAPLACETITFELTGYTPTGAAGRFQQSDFVEPDPNVVGRSRLIFLKEFAYEDIATGNQARRPIERVRTQYRSDDLTTLLPLGKLESLALSGETYKLAFTPGLIAQVFKRPRVGQPDEVLLPSPSAVLGGQGGGSGGHVDLDADDHWWIPSGRPFFSADPTDTVAVELTTARQHFFLPRRYHDPFGQDATVGFDSSDLLIVETKGALGNLATAINDYRVLQPRLLSDPNLNQVAVTFDTLGLVAGTAVMGKVAVAPTVAEGDSLAVFAADLTQAQIDGFHDAADPHTIAPALLVTATTRILYDLERFRRTRAANPSDPTQWLPSYAATLAREMHGSDLPAGAVPKIQIGLSYSDGFGREIQKKFQAEPGPIDLDEPNAPVVSPRWVGSGWTIFNNKGKPVRTYEPFFSATHDFEFGVQVGVSPILFYDPVDRVVATVYPNGTYEKALFDPWQQTTWDANDTVKLDPRTDSDVESFFVFSDGTARVPDSEYRPLWYALRTDPTLAVEAAARWPDATILAAEKTAAIKAATHAGTPTTVYFDALGRPFLTIARNRVVCANHPLDGTQEDYATRVDLDIEGNQRAVRDERKLPVNFIPLGMREQRVVVRYNYDLLGHRIYQLSMEAGARWILNDIAGNPLCAWDSRGHRFRSEYDPLRRPVRSFATGVDPANPVGEILVDRQVYGEQHPNAVALNLLGKPFVHLDQSGAAQSEQYDFKGNLVRASQRITREYKKAVDWSAADAAIEPDPTKAADLTLLKTALDSMLDAEIFISGRRCDALNRPVQSIVPHASARCTVIQHVFNDSNLLNNVDVWLDHPAEPPGLVDPANLIPSAVGISNIDYDAKGQRQRIDYKNGASTRYGYDPATFRLIQLYTRRGAAFTGDCDNPQPPPATIAAPILPLIGKYCGLQNLGYVYDPAGNITHIQDAAQSTIYFNNKRVEPSNDYTYDATYRLIEATGREHLGQTGGVPNAPSPHSYNDTGRVGIPTAGTSGQFSPYDGMAMGTYKEQYVYDAVGNFQRMTHLGADPSSPGWHRNYAYAEASLIEPARQSNRLSATTVGAITDNYSTGGDGYDPHGNMLRMPQLQVMQWDYRDQLQMTQRQKVNAEDRDGIKHLGERTWYVYNSAGQRLRKVTESAQGDRKNERLYLGGFEVYREYAPAGGALSLERETLHIMDDRQRIALIETRTSGDDPVPARLVRYQFGNHLGSASLELDDVAQIISYEEYSPYGSSTFQAVRSQTETSKRYRYTGMERDEESGLNYHRARYYASWIGRWMSCDPIGLNGGINLYAYTSCPTQMVDRSGQAGEIPPEAQHLLDEVNRVLGPHRLDASTFEAATFEAQGGRIEAASSNEVSKHIQGLDQALTDARRVEKNLQVLLEDTRDLAAGKPQLEQAQRTLRARISLADDTQATIRFLQNNFAKRYAGLDPLVAQGRSEGAFVSERLNGLFAAGEIKGDQLTLVPEVAAGAGAPTQLAGLLGRFRAIRPSSTVTLYSLPHPAALKQIAVEGYETASKAAADVYETAGKLFTQASGGLAKLARGANYALAVYGAYNATEESNKGHGSVPSEWWLTEFAALTAVGLVDAAGASAKTAWGDWYYFDTFAESYADKGMSPLQRDFAKWAQ